MLPPTNGKVPTPSDRNASAMASVSGGLPGNILHSDKSGFRVYAARFHMLIIFASLGFINQFMYLCFAPIPDQTARRYEVSSEAVTAIALECVFLFLPGSWLSAWVLARYDLRSVILTGGVLQTIGSLVRCAADLFVRPLSTQLGYATLFIGQGLSALASPCFMNTPVVMAESWFDERGRESAVSVGTLAGMVGQGAGSLGTGVFGLWAACAFRSAPPSPPSLTAGTIVPREMADGESATPKPSTLSVWGRLLCRPQFLVIMAVFDGGLFLATVLLTLFARMIGKCGYSSAVAGYASGLFMLGGIVGAVASGAAMGATRAYRSILRVTISLTVLGGWVFCITLTPDHTTRLLVVTFIFGMFMLSVLPVLLANAVEETYPVSSDASASLLYASAILLQVLCTPLFQAVLDVDGDNCGGVDSPWRLLTYGISVVLCLIPAWIYRGEYNRLRADAGALL